MSPSFSLSHQPLLPPAAEVSEPTQPLASSSQSCGLCWAISCSVVAHQSRQELAAQASAANDKNAALVFDMESGETKEARPKVEAIPEADDE